MNLSMEKKYLILFQIDFLLKEGMVLIMYKICVPYKERNEIYNEFFRNNIY